MIFNLLIYLVLLVVTSIFSLLPVVSISTIPVIGPTVASWLLYTVKLYNGLISTFPYAQVAFQVLIYVIIPFELLMLLGKFLLGHRLPINNQNHA